MHALMPIAATAEMVDGSAQLLTRNEAAALFLANRSTAAVKRLSIVGGRNEFERTLQWNIIQWLAEHEQPGRPRLLCIGDSIRMRQSDTTGYGLHAYRHLLDAFNITHVAHNTENSGLVSELIDDWLQCKPDVVHFNAGLHDLSTSPGTDVLPSWHHPIPRYQDNLRRIITAMKRANVRTIIWASSTPVHDGWHNTDVRTGKMRGVMRTNADVIAYNNAAAQVMAEHDIPINDLYSVVQEHGIEQCLIADGVHLSAYGADVVGRHVAATIRRLAGPPEVG